MIDWGAVEYRHWKSQIDYIKLMQSNSMSELDDLKHDIERYIKIANDLATENAKLRELLIEIGMQLTSSQLNAETRRKLIQATTDK